MGVLLSTLLYAALRVAGITDRPGRTPSPDQLADVFAIFNRMVGSWNNIRLNIFSWLITAYTLTANQQTYTIGPGGSGPHWINAPRPVRLERANLLITSNPNPVRRAMNILEPADWAAKRVQQILGPPLDIYPDYADVAGLSTWYFWPIPDQNYPAEFYTWSQIPVATATTNLIQLPPGYEEAIVFNLAKRIAAQFPSQANMSPAALEMARASLSAIQSHNTRSPRLVNDAAGIGAKGRKSDFNWVTGTP